MNPLMLVLQWLCDLNLPGTYRAAGQNDVIVMVKHILQQLQWSGAICRWTDISVVRAKSGDRIKFEVQILEADMPRLIQVPISWLTPDMKDVIAVMMS